MVTLKVNLKDYFVGPVERDMVIKAGPRDTGVYIPVGSGEYKVFETTKVEFKGSVKHGNDGRDGSIGLEITSPQDCTFSINGVEHPASYVVHKHRSYLIVHFSESSSDHTVIIEHAHGGTLIKTDYIIPNFFNAKINVLIRHQ